MRRADGFFRGSEFPRLLFLLGLLVVGGIVVVQALGRQAERDARPLPRTADVDPLPPADDALELSGVLDREPLNSRENPGYLMLLERVRATPPETLAERARRDVLFSQLINNPARYRGLPIHVEGTMLRCLEQSSTGSKLFPQGRFFEGWSVTADSQGFPWILVFENPPPGLPIGDDLNAYFVYDGYFFKLMAYVAGDTPRFAPLLVGRLRWIEPPKSNAPAPVSFPWWLPVLGLLAVLGIVRWIVYIRNLARRPPPRRYFGSVREEIDPDKLADWLNSPHDSRILGADEEASDDDPPRR